jgi:hypothetical protein
MHKTISSLVIFSLMIGVIASSSCKNEPDRSLVISKLKNTAKLSTVEYIVTKVVSARIDKRFSADDYFFAETEATIKAGIDLEKLREEDVEIDGKKISLKLPPIEILNFSYPSEGFKVIEAYTDDNSLFKWNSLSVETKDDLYRQAEADIRESLNDLGITKTAEHNTKLLLNKILVLSGYEEIYIDFREGPEKLVTPDQQILKDLSKFLEKNKKN